MKLKVIGLVAMLSVGISFTGHADQSKAESESQPVDAMIDASENENAQPTKQMSISEEMTMGIQPQLVPDLTVTSTVTVPVTLSESDATEAADQTELETKQEVVDNESTQSDQALSSPQAPPERDGDPLQDKENIEEPLSERPSAPVEQAVEQSVLTTQKSVAPNLLGVIEVGHEFELSRPDEKTGSAVSDEVKAVDPDGAVIGAKHFREPQVITIEVSAKVDADAGVDDSLSEDDPLTETVPDIHVGPGDSNESGKQDMCSGFNQSPVNLSEAVDALLPPLDVRYQPGPLDLMHEDWTLKLRFDAGGELIVGDQPYQLKALQFYAPGEHTVQGMSFPMEAQLIHQHESGQILMVGVLFKEGQSHPMLTGLWKHGLGLAPGQQLVSDDIHVNVYGLLPMSKDYVQYNGSLTRPPCTEGVKWIVMTEVVEASSQQIRDFAERFGSQHRSIQPLNARTVLK
jgi:carbonic anhydrase